MQESSTSKHCWGVGMCIPLHKNIEKAYQVWYGDISDPLKSVYRYWLWSLISDIESAESQIKSDYEWVDHISESARQILWWSPKITCCMCSLCGVGQPTSIGKLKQILWLKMYTSKRWRCMNIAMLRGMFFCGFCNALARIRSIKCLQICEIKYGAVFTSVTIVWTANRPRILWLLSGWHV